MYFRILKMMSLSEVLKSLNKEIILNSKAISTLNTGMRNSSVSKGSIQNNGKTKKKKKLHLYKTKQPHLFYIVKLY